MISLDLFLTSSVCVGMMVGSVICLFGICYPNWYTIWNNYRATRHIKDIAMTTFLFRVSARNRYWSDHLLRTSSSFAWCCVEQSQCACLSAYTTHVVMKVILFCDDKFVLLHEEREDEDFDFSLVTNLTDRFRNSLLSKPRQLDMANSSANVSESISRFECSAGQRISMRCRIRCLILILRYVWLAYHPALKNFDLIAMIRPVCTNYMYHVFR